MNVYCKGGAIASDYRIMVDWLSFTIPIDFSTLTAEYRILKQLNDTLHDHLGNDWNDIILGVDEWTPASGRAPYSASFTSGQGIRIYFNPKVDNILVEVEGHGCDLLRGLGVLKSIVNKMRNRMTRVDIAVDLKTDVTPSEFVEASRADRFKSRSSIASETGLTEYIGSRKSERYCRVYRYAPPHPRSPLIRSEFIFRKKSAKILAEQLVESEFNLTAIALGAGQVYGFAHEVWSMQGDEIALTSYSPERKQGKTMFWLIAQCAPAFKKLVRDGVIDDPEKFLREHFLDREDT